MFRDWFNRWVRENPTDIYRPAVIVGVVGGAVVAATMIVVWGQPYATASVQTGPRGTGMSITKFPGGETDPTVEANYTEAPYIPTGGEELAGAAYKNVQVLGDLTVDNFNRVMNAMTFWVAPEQGCAYCHGDGDMETYGSDDLYTKVVARRMIQMTQQLNDDWGGHTNVSGEAGVTCFTCHRGANVPSNVWFRLDPVNEAASGWSAVQNRVTRLSGSTSLPSDALPVLLAGEGAIKVHSLEPRAENAGSPTIQDAERTYALMNYFANSLNVNCNFCHNSRAFNDTGQVTPQWATALMGIDMVKSVNGEHLAPLAEVLPANRLGPVHGDAPKLACATCHKGYQKPLNGAHVIADWPELAAPGAPAYD